MCLNKNMCLKTSICVLAVVLNNVLFIIFLFIQNKLLNNF